MYSEALVKLALRELGCSQKELAVRLGVSAAQISKWKQGERMSSDMEDRFRDLVMIGERDPDFVYAAGSIDAAQKWEKLIRFLGGHALENAETGYNTWPLQDDMGLLSAQVFDSLESLGLRLPITFPENLDVDYETIWQLDDEEGDKLYEYILDGNEISSSIYSAFLVLNDLWGFYAAYIRELIDALQDAGEYDFEDIEPCLLSLAFGKADLDVSFLPNLAKFRSEIFENYETWLTRLKRACVIAKIPIADEPMKLILDEPGSLGHDSEFVSMGFNKRQIHPDVYMNEILCTLRTINHVLPAIVKKLGITEEELNLDELELTLK